MRKSNWLVVAILIVASIIFLAMWYWLGFNLVDDPLDLVVTIVWWVVILAVCIIITVVENKRRRSMRTSFVAPGIIKVEEGNPYVPALQNILNNLDYGFDKKNVSNEKRIRFKYIIRSDKFSDNGNTWQGEVVKVSNPDDIRHFQNKKELSALIDAA